MERLRIDEDGGAVRFAPCDQGALTVRLCGLLDAKVDRRQLLVWVERVDLVSEDGSFPLFHDEDGSSHLELVHLGEDQRQRVISRLRARY